MSDEKKVEQKTAVWPKPPGPESPAKDLPDEHPDKPKAKVAGERVSALAWLCPCGLEMSYAERPVCTCGKSVRP